MKNIIYLNDNELTLIRDKEYRYELQGLSKGAINNVKVFLEEINAILKCQKVNRGIVGEDLKLYLNEPLTPINETFYKELFTDLGFNNIEVLSISIFLDEKTTIYLISNKNSCFLYHNSHYYEVPNFDFLTDIKFKNPLKIFGNNPEIEKLKNDLKTKLDTKVYLFYPPENYILNLIKK